MAKNSQIIRKHTHEPRIMNVEAELQKLNWNKNDARIYVALVELGIATTQEIHEATGIDRTRIYDSLKRLINKEYAIKEQKEWGGRYQAMPVNDVLGSEIKLLNKQLETAKNVKEELIEIEKNKGSEEQLVWAIQGKKNVHDTLLSFIDGAQKRLFWLMSPDLFGPPVQSWVFDKLISKKITSGKDFEIQVSLQVNDGNKEYVRKLIREGINVYNRDETLLPLQLLIVDKNKFIQLSISAFEPLAEYNFGIYGMNVSEDQSMQGMEYMFYHLLKDHDEIDLDYLERSE